MAPPPPVPDVRVIIVGLVLAACAGCRGMPAAGEAERGQAEVMQPTAAAETRPARVASAPAGEKAKVSQVPNPVANPPDPENFLRLPDGTYVPALNGVVHAPPMNWPEERPFSPIIHKEADPKGTEWYIHADGSRSTTTNLFRKDLGRAEAVTIIATPVR